MLCVLKIPFLSRTGQQDWQQWKILATEVGKFSRRVNAHERLLVLFWTQKEMSQDVLHIWCCWQVREEEVFSKWLHNSKGTEIPLLNKCPDSLSANLRACPNFSLGSAEHEQYYEEGLKFSVMCKCLSQKINIFGVQVVSADWSDATVFMLACFPADMDFFSFQKWKILTRLWAAAVVTMMQIFAATSDTCQYHRRAFWKTSLEGS